MPTVMEAKPIILDWQKQGLKVGFVAAGGNFHIGHAACCTAARAHCDKLVINASSYVEKPGQVAWEQLDDFWDKFIGTRGSNESTFPYDPTLSAGALNATMSQYVDLILTPQPSDHADLTKEMEEDLAKEVSRYKDYFSAYPSYDLVQDYEVANHLWWYWVDKYQWPVDVRIRSWKDGMWNFRHQYYWKEVMGREYVMFAPAKGQDGTIISSSDTKIYAPVLADLKSLIISTQVSKDTVKEDFASVKLPTPEVIKYAGPLTKYVDPNATVVTIQWRLSDIPGNVEKGSHSYTHTEVV